MIETISTESQLDDILTRPSHKLQEFIRTLASPLVILGASGKMGPTLAVLAKRAAVEAGHALDVIAVARFSDPASRSWLEEHGVRTVQCDLLKRDEVTRLPEAENVIYMAGRKFGTLDNAPLTWAMNMLPPEYVAERYSGARIVALSTGCVYPLVPVDNGGSVEDDPLTPLGEYSNACVARERIFDYLATVHNTPICLIRLNYAVDLRYGVLVDIAGKIFHEIPIDLTMGYLNYIWQGDANEMVIRSLDLATSPARALNLTGQEIRSVRNLAVEFGELLGKEPTFTGVEAAVALLSDPSKAYSLLGPPSCPHESIMKWTAEWIATGRRTLGKPTHYEQMDGSY